MDSIRFKRDSFPGNKLIETSFYVPKINRRSLMPTDGASRGENVHPSGGLRKSFQARPFQKAVFWTSGHFCDEQKIIAVRVPFFCAKQILLNNFQIPRIEKKRIGNVLAERFFFIRDDPVGQYNVEEPKKENVLLPPRESGIDGGANLLY